MENKYKVHPKPEAIVVHLPETDAELDMDAILEMLGKGLHTDFERHVASVMRIDKLDENRPRPIKLVIKSIHGKKQILARAK